MNCLWAQLGLNQRPPDYESGATNQLSYGPQIGIDRFLRLQRYNNEANFSNHLAKKICVK